MYLTFFKKLADNTQYTIQDYLNHTLQKAPTQYKKLTIKTNTPPKYYNKEEVQRVINELIYINNKYNIENINEYYYNFAIPKKTGGLRQISAPNDELKQDLRTIKGLLVDHLKILEHEKAFAYVKNRNCKDSLEIHKENRSRWFLKLDIKDFFPSCSLEFTIKMLKQIYPLQDISKEDLKKALKICFKDNALPQGTPTSPILTNLLMIPIDYAIEEYCNKHYLIYTRYADDILISKRDSFNWQVVQDKINNILQSFEAPFQIKTEKTRYGSSAGRNWNLGLMFNKDNEITIGAAKKKTFKAMLTNFALDFKNQTYWSREDTRHLIGLMSYYISIEPKYIKELIKKYEFKYHINYKVSFKWILNN